MSIVVRASASSSVDLSSISSLGQKDLQPYSKSKLELITKKKLNTSDAKIFSPVFIPFFFAIKAKLQVLEFEFCQIKLR